MANATSNVFEYGEEPEGEFAAVPRQRRRSIVDVLGSKLKQGMRRVSVIGSLFPETSLSSEEVKRDCDATESVCTDQHDESEDSKTAQFSAGGEQKPRRSSVVGTANLGIDQMASHLAMYAGSSFRTIQAEAEPDTRAWRDSAASGPRQSDPASNAVPNLVASLGGYAAAGAGRRGSVGGVAPLARGRRSSAANNANVLLTTRRDDCDEATSLANAITPRGESSQVPVTALHLQGAYALRLTVESIDVDDDDETDGKKEVGPIITGQCIRLPLQLSTASGPELVASLASTSALGGEGPGKGTATFKYSARSGLTAVRVSVDVSLAAEPIMLFTLDLQLMVIIEGDNEHVSPAVLGVSTIGGTFMGRTLARSPTITYAGTATISKRDPGIESVSCEDVELPTIADSDVTGRVRIDGAAPGARKGRRWSVSA